MQPFVLKLRLEAAAVLVLCLALYAHSGRSWWLFAALFLVPDVGMLAYLRGPRVGAVAYNLAHTYVAPALLLALASLGWRSLTGPALIWAAHIAFDRSLGYGLKDPAGFHHTHLGSIGEPASPGNATNYHRV